MEGHGSRPVRHVDDDDGHPGRLWLAEPAAGDACWRAGAPTHLLIDVLTDGAGTAAAVNRGSVHIGQRPLGTLVRVVLQLYLVREHEATLEGEGQKAKNEGGGNGQLDGRLAFLAKTHHCWLTTLTSLTMLVVGGVPTRSCM